MSKIILSLILIFFCTVTNAQLEKGVWLFGGSGSIYSYNDVKETSGNNELKVTDIDLSGTIGNFVMDKFAVGLRPYVYSTAVNYKYLATDNKFLFSKLAIGPFMRYYFLNQSKEVNLLADLSYQFGIIKSKLTDSSPAKGKYNSLNLMAGTELFLNSTIGVEILAGYRKVTESIENSDIDYEDRKSGVQLSIGFQLHL